MNKQMATAISFRFIGLKVFHKLRPPSGNNGCNILLSALARPIHGNSHGPKP